MSVHIDSPLGYTAQFPDFTQALDDSTAGPETEQFALPGNVLVTVIKDATSVKDAPQITGWAHLMSEFYLRERGGQKLTEGELDLPGKASFAVVVGYTSADGSPKAAATVGIWEESTFLGIVVIWPFVDPELEPRLELLRDVVGAIRVK